MRLGVVVSEVPSEGLVEDVVQGCPRDRSRHHRQLPSLLHSPGDQGVDVALVEAEAAQPSGHLDVGHELAEDVGEGLGAIGGGEPLAAQELSGAQVALGIPG